MPWRQRDGWSTWDLSVPPPAAGFPSFPFFSLFPPPRSPCPGTPPCYRSGSVAGWPAAALVFVSARSLYFISSLPSLFGLFRFPVPCGPPRSLPLRGRLAPARTCTWSFFFLFFFPSPSTAAVPSNLPRREPSARHPGRLVVFDSEIYRRFRARPEGGFWLPLCFPARPRSSERGFGFLFLFFSFPSGGTFFSFSVVPDPRRRDGWSTAPGVFVLSLPPAARARGGASFSTRPCCPGPGSGQAGRSAASPPSGQVFSRGTVGSAGIWSSGPGSGRTPGTRSGPVGPGDTWRRGDPCRGRLVRRGRGGTSAVTYRRGPGGGSNGRTVGRPQIRSPLPGGPVACTGRLVRSRGRRRGPRSRPRCPRRSPVAVLSSLDVHGRCGRCDRSPERRVSRGPERRIKTARNSAAQPGGRGTGCRGTVGPRPPGPQSPGATTRRPPDLHGRGVVVACAGPGRGAPIWP